MLRTPVVVSGSNCKLTGGAEQQTRESGFKNRRDNTPQQQQQHYNNKNKNKETTKGMQNSF